MKSTWQGTAGELLVELSDEPWTDERARKQKGWPSNARGMAGALRCLAPELRRQGIEVDLPVRGDKHRLYRIYKVQSRPPQPPNRPKSPKNSPNDTENAGLFGRSADSGPPRPPTDRPATAPTAHQPPTEKPAYEAPEADLGGMGGMGGSVPTLPAGQKKNSGDRPDPGIPPDGEPVEAAEEGWI